MDAGMMIMKGAPVAAAIVERATAQIEKLKAQGNTPCLATLRIGEDGGDISYEKSIIKRFSAAGAEVKVNVLPKDVSQAELESALQNLNEDKSVDGILTFRPYPRGLSEERIKKLIDPGKDVDGMSPANLASVFQGILTVLHRARRALLLRCSTFTALRLRAKEPLLSAAAW